MPRVDLRWFSTLLVLVGSDEKDSGLGDDFLDKVLTDTKTQVKNEIAIKTAKELNPNNEGKELFDAIHSGNTALALELIKKGVNLYYQGEDRLHYREVEVSLSLAVVRNNMTVVKAMLSAGAYPDLQVTTTDATALTEAIRYGIFEMAEVLVKGKANVNLRTKTGWTPLIHAAFIHRDAKFIKLLLDNGADPNIFTDEGYSALSHALRNKDKTFANLLAPVSSEENKIRSEKKLAEDLEWLAKDNAEEAKQKAIDLEKRKQEAQSKNEAKAAEALREYSKLKEDVDYYMKRHNEAVTKYNRAGKEAQIFYKGTFAEMHQTLRNVDRLITDYLEKYEKYIPIATYRELKSLQEKVRSGPVHQDAPK